MTLILSNKEWSNILTQIREEHGLSASIHWQLRERYGFRSRKYTGFDTRIMKWVDDTRLDFDSEAHATFFQLKYL
jgi:hypothetical protein